MVKDLNDPTNVDSVPAMLTPGEYVVNKEATQMFGPQIHAMNQAGLQQRHMENMNMGGYMGYNTGGLVSFLKKHEGWKDKAYQDSAGIWTIGYGRTRNADGSAISPNQTTTRKDEDSWIEKRAQDEWSAINSYADKHGYDWSDKEKEALASFRYNGGQGMIDMLTADGTRDMDTIKSKFGLYNKAGGKKVDGLVNRRNHEMEHAGWGTVGAAPEGSSATTFQMAGQPAAVPEPEAPPPDPRATSPRPQLRPDEVDVSPRAEAPDQQAAGTPFVPQPEASGLSLPNFDIGSMLPALLGGGGGGGAMPPPPQGGKPMQYNDPRFWMSPQQPQGYNWGGWVKELFSGPDQNAGYANYSQQDFLNEAETFNNPGAQTEGYAVPEMARPAMPGQPMMPTAQPGGGIQNRGASVANHAGNRFMFESPTGEAIPELQTAPPVPGTDEALLQGSSDTVERIEEEQLTAKQQWDRLKSERDALPRGDRRTELSNQMNQLNVADPAMDPRTGLRSGAATGARGMAAPTAGGPTTRGRGARAEEAYQAAAQREEDIWRTNEALQQAQLQAAVTAPDAPGAEFIQSRVNALSDNLTEMGVPPESQGVGVDVGVNEDPVTGVPAPPGMMPPEEVGGVPGIETAAPGQQSERLDTKGQIPIPQKRAAVEEKLQAANAEPASQEETAAAESAGSAAPPEKVEKAKNILQENFGDLFDKKELARAAVLFAGAMLTGASPQKALAIAGQQYLGRLDAKEAMRVKTEQDRVKAAQKGAPTIDMTQSEEFVVGNKRVKGFKMTKTLPDGSKVVDYVTNSGQPIPANRHQNFDQVPGTSEYNKRVATESKSYASQFDELQKLNEFETDAGTQVPFKLSKSRVGRDVSQFGIRNNIPAEAMGSLVSNAYNAMLSDQRNGATPKSIEPYLNKMFIEAEVGADPSLFGDAQADEVMGMMHQFTRLSGQPNNKVLQAAQNAWTRVPPEEKARFESRAKGTNKSPFMLWMEADLQDATINNF